MLRVGDLKRSIDWYTQNLGMKLLRIKDFPDEAYTLAFVGYGSERDGAVLEFTYNYGRKEYPKGEAYGHVCLGVDDVTATVAKLRANKVEVTYESDDGFMAFIVDPDGYQIELLHCGRMLAEAEADYVAQKTAAAPAATAPAAAA